MDKSLNLIGQTFSHLTVVFKDEEKSKNRPNSQTYWFCKCDCGNPNLKSARYSRLKNGETSSCGKCDQYKLIGKQFGELTILDVDSNYWKTVSPYNKTYFKCQCSCKDKTIVMVESSNLKRGTTKSCGCKRKEQLITIQQNRKKDYSGKKFGKLTVLREELNAETRTWICQCDCSQQNIIKVKQSALLSGNVKSCGCLKDAGKTGQSIGSKIIEQHLIKLNIQFQKEKTFSSLKNPKTNSYLRFDFYLPKHQTLIEFDGAQHFKSSGNYFNGTLEQIQYRDKIKNEWCKQNNFKLIRISYKEINEIQDLNNFKNILGFNI